MSYKLVTVNFRSIIKSNTSILLRNCIAMKEFFIIVNGQQQGPFTTEQLAEMAITPETEVWTNGMADWKQAGDVPELTSLLQQLQFHSHMERTSVTPPPYVASAASEAHAPKAEDYNQWDRTAQQTPAAPPAEPSKPEKSRGGSGCGTKLLLALLIFVILGGVLAVTCPSRQDHKDAVSLSTRQWVGDKLDAIAQNNDLLSIFTGAVEWISGQGIDFVIDQYLDVDNYGVCSIGRVNLGEKSKVVSVGVLNHVFTFDKEDVDQLFMNALKDKIGLGSAPAIQHRSDPTITEEGSSEEDDSYLATPSEQDSIMEAQRSSNPAEELLDSLAVKAKREAIKTAKEWAKKQIDRLGNGN